MKLKTLVRVTLVVAAPIAAVKASRWVSAYCQELRMLDKERAFG